MRIEDFFCFFVRRPVNLNWVLSQFNWVNTQICCLSVALESDRHLQDAMNPAMDYCRLTNEGSADRHDVDKNYEPETGCSNEEERELLAWLKELQFQERRIQEDRKRKQDAERAMERKLNSVKQKDEEVRREPERKERLKALKLEAQRIQARLYEEEEEDKRC